MTLTNLAKAPFPWFGGKSGAAEAVWAALGDVPHYVEPFAGSMAVLLGRPHEPNRPYHSETVNDIDGLLVNLWRSIRWHPDETAEAASWPVSELDKHARSVTLVSWRESEAVARLAGDARWCDPEMAGWWVWAVACQIGQWGSGGPWWPDESGRLRRRPRSAGVTAQLPHLGDDGRGVNNAAVRERGLGVTAQLPHLGNDGRGVNRPQLREPGLGTEQTEQADQEPFAYHDITMPELRRWFAYLSARLRHVRILNGDWARCLTTGASHTLRVRMADAAQLVRCTGGYGPVGVFLDPPYGDIGRVSLYGKHEDFSVAEKVRAWCLEHGDNPRKRIVYAGYDTEGTALEDAGWTVVEWFGGGWLSGGMGNVAGTAADGSKGHQQHRERLWLSPHCVQPVDESEGALW